MSTHTVVLYHEVLGVTTVSNGKVVERRTRDGEVYQIKTDNVQQEFKVCIKKAQESPEFFMEHVKFIVRLYRGNSPSPVFTYNVTTEKGYTGFIGTEYLLENEKLLFDIYANP